MMATSFFMLIESLRVEALHSILHIIVLSFGDGR